MADFEIDMEGLDLFRTNLEALEKDFPKQAKTMLGKVGAKAAVVVRRKARQLVKKKTGNYQRSIKRGKVWKGSDGQYYVRVYPSSKIAPHAHLIEFGHRIVDKDGHEHGFKEGLYVFEKGVREVEAQFEEILVNEFYKIMNKL